MKAKKGSAHAPKHIKFVDELPMTGVGKVDKKVLKAGFWTGRERMVGKSPAATSLSCRTRALSVSPRHQSRAPTPLFGGFR